MRSAAHVAEAVEGDEGTETRQQCGEGRSRPVKAEGQGEVVRETEQRQRSHGGPGCQAQEEGAVQQDGEADESAEARATFGAAKRQRRGDQRGEEDGEEQDSVVHGGPQRIASAMSLKQWARGPDRMPVRREPALSRYWGRRMLMDMWTGWRWLSSNFAPGKKASVTMGMR